RLGTRCNITVAIRLPAEGISMCRSLRRLSGSTGLKYFGRREFPSRWLNDNSGIYCPILTVFDNARGYVGSAQSFEMSSADQGAFRLKQLGVPASRSK